MDESKHNMTANLTLQTLVDRKARTANIGRKARTANIGLPKAGLTWVIEQLCFYFTFVLGDRLVLLMPRLRQAVKRYSQW